MVTGAASQKSAAFLVARLMLVHLRNGFRALLECTAALVVVLPDRFDRSGSEAYTSRDRETAGW